MAIAITHTIPVFPILAGVMFSALNMGIAATIVICVLVNVN
jgi:hypothetical protein